MLEAMARWIGVFLLLACTAGEAGSPGDAETTAGDAGTDGSEASSEGSAGEEGPPTNPDPGGSGTTDPGDGTVGTSSADATSTATTEPGGPPDGPSFFVTSVGTGRMGGDYGGLAGADALCQSLADAAGIGDANWRAYLSTTAENARDRIGNGPWTNVDGDVVAEDLDALHSGPKALDPDHALDELGQPIPQMEHDINTGSLADGTVYTGRTCADWTSSSDDDVAQIGHSDIVGGLGNSWNSAHDSAGCSETGLIARWGSGRLYCFAAW